MVSRASAGRLAVLANAMVLVGFVAAAEAALAAEDTEIAHFQTLGNGTDPVNGLHGSIGIAIAPDGKHVYATGSQDDAIVTLSRKANGNLVVKDTIFDTDPGIDGLDQARGVTVSPDNKHVYVASLSEGVAVFSRDTTTGLLTFVENLRDDTAGGGSGLAGAQDVRVSADGKHVYVVALTDDAITVFERNAASGALTFGELEKDGVNGVSGMTGASTVTITPDDKFVYVAAEDSDSVAVFARNALTGELTFVEALFDGVGGVQGLNGSNAVAVSPDGKHLYVTGLFDNGVTAANDTDLGAVFSRDASDGTLTFVQVIPPFVDTSGSFECVGLYPGHGGVAVDGGGTRAYVTEHWFSALLVYSRNRTNGKLALIEAHCGFLEAQQGNINRVIVGPDDYNVYVTGLAGAPSTYAPQCSGLRATIVGTGRGERINGTNGGDVIQARGGNDRVFGRGGADVICGGLGDDNMSGGDQNDVIVGGLGKDKVSGDKGSDTVDFSGAPGAVRVDLTTGTTSGAHGVDTIQTVENIKGSPFNDQLTGNGVKNRIEGGAGKDKLIGKGGNDVLIGGPGGDTANGGPGTDTCQAETKIACE